jgi:pyruvate formate lyase activating enzyme
MDGCPTGAMKILGIDQNVDWLFHELIKDKAYFGPSGGVTFSGGEVLIQAKNAAKLAQKLLEAGIPVALDTSGYAEYRNLMELRPYVDLVLYDLKHIDPVRHQALTGVDNHLILENLIRLNQTGIRIWIRTPIIPNATDTPANIEGIAHFLKENDIRYERWELCAFNNLCIDKYKRLGKDWAYEKRLLMDKATMDRLTQIANDIINDCDRPVIWTGMTRLEEK